MKYETVNGWTKRTMINHIKKNFTGQSFGVDHKKSKGVNCFYRGPNGKKCAVGLFIPDDMYTPGMERKSVISLCDIDNDIESALPLNPAGMEYLQQQHDNGIRKSSKDATLKRMLNWINENVK